MNRLIDSQKVVHNLLGLLIQRSAQDIPHENCRIKPVLKFHRALEADHEVLHLRNQILNRLGSADAASQVTEFGLRKLKRLLI